MLVKHCKLCNLEVYTKDDKKEIVKNICMTCLKKLHNEQVKKNIFSMLNKKKV